LYASGGAKIIVSDVDEKAEMLQAPAILLQG
jgi:hypothetical protein